jgi:hypothetical protein
METEDLMMAEAEIDRVKRHVALLQRKIRVIEESYQPEPMTSEAVR